MPDNIKWLFFDLGYTLIDEHAAHEKRIKDCIEYQRRRYGRTFTYEQIYNEMCRASADYRQQFYGAMANRIIVFDIGGTLIEFDNMPLNWSVYYPRGFKRLAESLGYAIADEEKDRQTALHNGCRFLLHKGTIDDFSELYLKCVGG